MGYMRHHAIMVTSWQAEKVSALYAAAKELGLPVSETVAGHINGYTSFLVAPDGSKEGWALSTEGDLARDKFVALIREHVYDDGSSSVDWAEVQYGDDDNEARIVRSGDDDRNAVTP